MKLFPHQIEALKATENLNKVAYYLDMGLGKTFVGSEKMIQLGSGVNLVICQKSKIQDWVDHFQKYYGLPVYNMTKKDDFERFFEMTELVHGIVGVINYDLIFRRKDFLNLQDFTLMLDESSLIQNEKAKRSKFILNMNPSNVILLSGTPTSGKYENLWSQIHLLGWNISQNTYNKQYINWKKIDVGGFIHKVVDQDNPYKNVDRLKSKMREHGAVFMKTEECFDLPEQNFIPVNCGSSKEYRRFKKNSIITILDDDKEIELIGDTTLTKMLYLRMLCGQYNASKLEAFKDLVESTNDRLIVFYNFKEEVKKLIHIANELDRPWAIISGDAKNLAAYDNYDNSITFVQYQAGSMGLNLQKANKIIYFTLPLLSEHFEQSKKRIHRIGQTNTCFYYLMICKGTIEEDILQLLEMRKDYTDELFREKEG
jgi:SNF2 family DNA or RNA helicase